MQTSSPEDELQSSSLVIASQTVSEVIRGGASAPGDGGRGGQTTPRQHYY